MLIQAILTSALMLAAPAVAQDEACTEKQCETTCTVKCTATVVKADDDKACAKACESAKPVVLKVEARADEACAKACEKACETAQPVALKVEACEGEGECEATCEIITSDGSKGECCLTVAGTDGDEETHLVLRNLGVDLVGLELSEAELVDLAELDLELAELTKELSALGYIAGDVVVELEESAGERGYLGVQMSLEDGMNILNVMPGSGAAEAGLNAGDRILMINGHSTADEGISELLEGLEAGESVKIVYQRGEKKHRGKVQLMTLGAIQGGPQPAPLAALGYVGEHDNKEHSDFLLTEHADVLHKEHSDVLHKEILKQVQLGHEGQPGIITIAIAGADGEPQIIEERVIEIGDGEGEISFGLAMTDDDGQIRIFNTEDGSRGGGGGGKFIFSCEGEEDCGGGGGQFVISCEGEGDCTSHIEILRNDVQHLISSGKGDKQKAICIAVGEAECEGVCDMECGEKCGDKCTVDCDAEGERRAKILVKRMGDGEEQVEVLEWVDDDFEDLHGHLLELIEKRGGGLGAQLRARAGRVEGHRFAPLRGLFINEAAECGDCCGECDDDDDCCGECEGDCCGECGGDFDCRGECDFGRLPRYHMQGIQSHGGYFRVMQPRRGEFRSRRGWSVEASDVHRDLLHDLHEEIAELHERIDRLERLLQRERGGRRRGR